MTEAKSPTTPLSIHIAPDHRKSQRPRPKLPLSVFTPPPSGTTDASFPRPPSPSSVHPVKIIDAHARLCSLGPARLETQTPSTSQPETEAEVADSKSYSSKLEGSVVFITPDAAAAEDAGTIINRLSVDKSILAISLPYPLDKGVTLEPQIQSSSPLRIHLNVATANASPSLIKDILWALSRDYVVDLYTNVGQSGAGWEALGDILEKAMGPLEDRKGKVILNNVLPAPYDIETTLIKLLSAPTYLAYEKHIALLSLYSNIYLKFIPPSWSEQATPEASLMELSKGAKEWKKRVKMYLGPAIDAFGWQRIIFGSSPSPTPGSSTQSRAADWYYIARASIAELGVEQDDIDAVFAENAKRVYGPN